MLAMEAAGSSQWMDPIEPEMEGGAVLLGRGPRCWQVQQLREDHEAPFRRWWASALGQSAAKRTLLKAAGSSQRIEPIDAAAIGLVGPAFPK